MELARRLLADGRSFSLARGNGFVLWAFTVTLFTSALLLFSVQPMFARLVLPKLGGSPSVWAVSMCFFQAVLLCGYCYAHLLGRHFGAATGAMVHLGVCLAGFLLLPVALPEGFSDPGSSDAYLWLFGLFSLAVGLPFFAVSANAPLLQAWFARTGHPHANDPYFLYGASNIGSLVALLGYPLLIEPNLGLVGQSGLWTTGFAVLMGLIALSAWIMLSSAHASAPIEGARAKAAWRAPWSLRLRWITLAFVPSGLLVAFTTHLTTDVASAPFLWVGPLVLYLATYVLVFRDPPLIPDRWVRLLQIPAVAVAMLFILMPRELHFGVLIAIGTAAFFTTALVLHRQLYETRPPVSHLTEFYLWMSFGGVLGGIFTALVSPHVFTQVVEYPLLLVLGLLVRRDVMASAPVRALRAAPKVSVAVAALTFALATLAGSLFTEAGFSFGRIAGITCLVLAILGTWQSRMKLLAVAMVPALVFALVPPRIVELATERGFFGVHRVLETPDGQFRLLMHGTTLHGSQRLLDASGAPMGKLVPTSYYYADGAMSSVLRRVQGMLGADTSQQRFGVVGLGAGALACRARPGETWRFYEIDPLVVEIATNPKYFNFMSQCAPSAPIVVGDARLTLQKEPDGLFDVLVIDAFSSDAIPVHLLTVEALKVYLSKLKPDGVLMLHVTNRYLELLRITEAVAREIPGLQGVMMRDRPKNGGLEKIGSDVVVLSRSQAVVDVLASDPRAKLLGPARTRAWTDDFSDVLGALMLGRDG
ncbi:MAG: spermidine synthase [Parvibaculaceae bacterium]